MILWLLNLFGGWYTVCGVEEDLADLLNLCMRFCFPYWRLLREGEQFTFCVRRRTWKEMAREAEALGLRLHPIDEGGLPRILRRYRKRWGLMIGVGLCLGLVWLSGRFVWRIEVNGIERSTVHDVTEALAGLDFGIGSYIPAVDVNALQAELLAACDRYAWVSINLHGTTAEIEVVERVKREQTARDMAPMNLVASADGQIVQFELRSGWNAVEVGDIVRAGDLLVSAIGQSKDERAIVSTAEGRVLAQVVHQLSAEIPLAYSTKVYTGEKTKEKRIFFFGKTINLFRSTGISGGSCDIIDNERIMSFFGRYPVPISLCTTTCLAYAEAPAYRDETTALRLAEHAVREQIDALGDDVTLLRRVETKTVTAESVRLDCTVWCIEDIADKSPIFLGESAETPPS